MCKITAMAGCQTGYIYQDPEASLMLVDKKNQTVASMPFGKSDIQDDGSFKFLLDDTANVYTVTDDTPKELSISYDYMHGDQEELEEYAKINACK